MSALLELLETAYEAFNARDLAGIRTALHPDVVWPDTLESGPSFVGREATMAQFAHIFATIVPNIALIRVVSESADALTVESQYSVESPDGHLWTDSRATLIYHFRDGLLSGLTIVGGL
ncbi:nuclear transport factor 2 family protein [Caulobacter sp. RL271]|jgi:ketosteroid isomerase-like protein|uniref:Nuclear transport factor 2 family protein n=1 Tax=Caulobacter segnis TaxID=88688 RepID=A0ABY4ZMX0_9CAUL|nr:nuclear transport factor 2 family protein [Caulobacter segnis]USQ94068.1 nuclear transport factor 2 family protein [Caulobacter segnis]